MPVLVILGFVIKGLCFWHAIKTKQERYWLALIFFPPVFGCLAYIVINILPDVLASDEVRRAKKQVQQKIDPERDVRVGNKQLKISDTVANKLNLAKTLMARREPLQAVPLYLDALQGLYAHDPKIMLGLAEAHFAATQYQECREVLEQLMQHNPEFRSAEGHLLYAQSLQALGEWADAQHEYEAVVQYYAGPEAKCRFAELLIKRGDAGLAVQQLDDVLDTAELALPFYRKQHKTWLQWAKREKAALELRR